VWFSKSLLMLARSEMCLELTGVLGREVAWFTLKAFLLVLDKFSNESRTILLLQRSGKYNGVPAKTHEILKTVGLSNIM
jgi:hypothetical protein